MHSDELFELIKRFIEHPSHVNILCIVGKPDEISPTPKIIEFIEKYKIPNSSYINLNLKIIEKLKPIWNKAVRWDKHNNITLLKPKIKKIVIDIIQEHFRSNNLLIIDHIDLLYKYEIDLIGIAHNEATGKKVCILCIPSTLYNKKIFSSKFEKIIKICDSYV